MAIKYPTAAELRMCVERILPDDMKREAAARAIALNPENDPLPAFRKAGIAGASVHPQKMALVTGKKWPQKQVLGVRFLDGSKKQRAKVQQHAEEWLAFVNVKFDWTAGTKAQLRVSFVADDGSWSAVGTDCLQTDYF